jgi:hypothetical protein
MLSRRCGWLCLVTPQPLLHLTTPAEWRAALATGAVHPPSLAEVGFVHLSTPDQSPVVSPYAGRRSPRYGHVGQYGRSQAPAGSFTSRSVAGSSERVRRWSFPRHCGHADALLTAELDWPRHWYARRGFEVVGTTFDAVRGQTGAISERTR